MNVRRPMVVEKDDEAQVSGAVNGRHIDNNPSDGLFKKPTQQGRVAGRPGHPGSPTAATCLEGEAMQEGVTGPTRVPAKTLEGKTLGAGPGAYNVFRQPRNTAETLDTGASNVSSSFSRYVPLAREEAG